MAPKLAAPTSEKGYVNPFPGLLTAFSQWDWFEQVPELIWPDSVRTYTRMQREDGRIASVLAAIALPIRRTAWRIDPNGAKSEVVKVVATSLGLPVVGEDENKPTPRTKGKFSWAEHLQQALLYLTYGHAIFEQVYEIDNGLAYLKKLGARPASSIAFWDVARDGTLNGIQQWPEGQALGSLPGMMDTNKRGMIPANRLVVYVRDPDPGIWVGNSILRPAYKHWLLKDELIRIEAATARRNGMGVPLIIPPEAESLDDDRIAKYANLASQYRGGNSAGLALPAGSEMKLLGVSGNLPDLRQAVEYHDKQMALAGLAHFLNLDRGGSYALASVQESTFTQSVQTVADQIRDTAQAHVVEDLVDINFGPDEPAPKLVCDEIGSRQDATAAALQMLVSAGLLTADPRLEAFIRQVTGLPALPEDHTATSDQTVDEPEAPPETEPIDTAQPPVTYTGAANASVRGTTQGDLTLW